MNFRKKGVQRMMLMSLGFVVTATVASAKVTVSRFPLHFQVTNPPCLSVPSTVTGDGEVLQVIKSTRNTDGTYRLDFNRVIQGTASDSAGTKYIFHDIDNFTINGSTTSPEATVPYTLVGTGKVALISKGGTPNVNLLMFINWQINADGSIIDLGSVFEGDLSCDPSTTL
jgi:hypothetical protein